MPCAKHIFGFLSQNVTEHQKITAQKLLFSGFLFKKGVNVVSAVENNLSNFFGGEGILLADSGRSALFLALQALGVKKDSEVVVQAYTCVAVINAILWLGAKPVYADIDPETLCATKHSVENVINKRTSCVVYQYTFGHMGDIAAVSALCREKGIPLIEDAAHNFDLRDTENPVGIYGEAVIYSFGSEKVISAVRLGAVRSKNTNLISKIKEDISLSPCTTFFQELQIALHPILFFNAQKRFSSYGRWMLRVSRIFGLIPKILSDKEKRGELPKLFPRKPSRVAAFLLKNELQTAENSLFLREKHYNLYRSKIPERFHAQRNTISIRSALGFPIRVENTAFFIKKAHSLGIHISDDWEGGLVVPKTASLPSNLSPKKENFSETMQSVRGIVLLPIHVSLSEEDLDRIVRLSV